MNKKFIFASHGNLSAGLLDAVKLIAGEVNNVKTYTLEPGDSAEDFTKDVINALNKDDNTQYIILTDLFGASVFNAFATIGHLENVFLFAGMNLGMALSVVLDQEEMSQEKAKHIIEENKSSIIYFEEFADESEDNDF